MMKGGSTPWRQDKRRKETLGEAGVREVSLEAMVSSASRNGRCFGIRLWLRAAAPLVVDF